MGSGKVPREAWKSWDESYKCAYPDYVATQREKEASVYAVKSALQRSNIFESLDEGWKSTAKAHFGTVSLSECLAVLAEQRMGRFGLSPAWRNMAVFGALDEIRHTQMDLYLAHEFVARDPQFDWALKAYHTNEWGIIAARALFDGMMLAPISRIVRHSLLLTSCAWCRLWPIERASCKLPTPMQALRPGSARPGRRIWTGSPRVVRWRLRSLPTIGANVWPPSTSSCTRRSMRFCCGSWGS